MGLGDWVKGLFGVNEADKFRAAGLRSREDATRDFIELNEEINQGLLREGRQAVQARDAAAQQEALRRAMPTLEAMAHLLDADGPKLASVYGMEAIFHYKRAVKNWVDAGHALLVGDWDAYSAGMAEASRLYDRAVPEFEDRAGALGMR